MESKIFYCWLYNIFVTISKCKWSGSQNFINGSDDEKNAQQNAEYVIVAMGSVCDTIKEVIDHCDGLYGLIEVHLFRPFSNAGLMMSLMMNSAVASMLS